MAFTDVQIINNGLSKIASSRIRQIAPPITPLEAFMAANYAQWRDEEIEKRRWVFAWEMDYQLTPSEILTGVSKPYKFLLPADAARPILREKDDWVQRGRYLHSACSTIKIDYIRNVTEADFPALFRGVVACRIGLESCEYVTQSNTKKQTMQIEYDKAVDEAGKANAFVIGREEYQCNDDGFSWLAARYDPTDQR